MVVRQVAPDARRRPLDACDGRRRRSSRYGFDGGTFPSPNGAPGQGWRVDPQIADQFDEWFADDGGDGAVVHDGVVRQPARHRLVVALERQRPAPRRARRRSMRALPPNFETPEQLEAQRKPRCSCSLQETSAVSFGAGALHAARKRSRPRGCRSSTST